MPKGTNRPRQQARPLQISRRESARPNWQKTLFEALQRQYPGEFANGGQLRTLQRRMKRWRATEGPGREVFFA